MKKTISILLTLAMVLALGSMTVFAEAPLTAADFAALETAISIAHNGQTIQLTADITATATITIAKHLTLDLNGHNLQVPGYGSNNIYVTGGSLEITGSGKIYEKEDNRWFGVVIVKDADYVIIGPDVILEGCGGVMLPGDATGDPSITIEGTIHSLKDKSGDDGWGLYINGTVDDKSSYPTFIVKNTAVINSTGHGIYAAGYGLWEIQGGSITGVASAIGIKAGMLIIYGGTLRATGPATIPTSGYSNGMNASGCAIQIESNSDYAGDIQIGIRGGIIISDKGYAIYEYIGKGAGTKVTGITATGGTFYSAPGLSGGILTSAELAGIAGAVDTADGTFTNVAASEVTANADVTYTVIIPASVDFGTIHTGLTNVSKDFDISVEDALLEHRYGIFVRVTTEAEDRVMRDKNGAGSKILAFTLSKTEYLFYAGNVSDSGDATQEGTISCNPSLLKAAGSYKGYMTFSVTYGETD